MKRTATLAGGKKLAQSALVQKNNLKKLLTPENFAKLSVENQDRLLALLPRIDVVENQVGTSRLTPGALSHEYFSHACVDYKDRLISGELSPYGHQKDRLNSFKPQWDPWKIKHFEEFWGEKLEDFDSEADSNGSSSADEQPIAKLLKKTQTKPVAKPTFSPKKRGRKPKRSRWNRGEIPPVRKPLKRHRVNQPTPRPEPKKSKSPEVPVVVRPPLPKVRVKLNRSNLSSSSGDEEIQVEKFVWSHLPTQPSTSAKIGTSNFVTRTEQNAETNGASKVPLAKPSVLPSPLQIPKQSNHARMNETTRVISVSPLKMRICLNGGAARQPCIIAPTIVRSPPDFPGFTEESLRETTCEGTPTHRLISFSPASDQNNRKGIKRPFSRVAQTPVDHMLIERRREGWGTDPRDFVRISGKPELIRVAGGNGTSPRQKCHVYGAKVNVRSQLSMNSRIMSDSIVGSRQIQQKILNGTDKASGKDEKTGSDVELITVE